MANGAFNFKNNSGNIVSFISGSGPDIIMSGGTLDLSSMTGLTLGNLTMEGTVETASFAPSYLLTSSFNTYSGTTNTVIGTLQTSTGSLNSFTSSASGRLNSIEGVTGSYATTGSNTFNGNLTVTGYIDAQELRTTYISSSILYRSGSTKFGDELTDTHAFTGSMLLSGSLNGVGVFATSGTGLNASVRINNTTSSTGKDWHLYSLNNGNFGLYNNTDGSYSYILTPSGNLGLGVTPSAWNTTSKALQLPQFVSLSHQHNGDLNLMSFALETSANTFTYADTGVFPARLNMNPNNGSITFFGAGTGTSGNTISWSTRFLISSTGNVGIGTSTFAYSPRLAVASVGQNSVAIQTTDTVEGSAGTVLYIGTGGSTGNSTYGVIRALGDGGTAATNLVLQPTGGAVGIGLTNPGAILDVSHSAGTTNIIRVSNGAGNYRWRVDQLFSMVMTNASNVDTFSVTTAGALLASTARISNFTTNGLVGTDASGNLGVVNSTYTEIATGTITYSMNSGAPWGINNSFPATIRDYNDDGMAGSGGVATNLNLNRGVTFDLGSAKAVRKIVERGYGTKNLDTIQVQYSTDNSNWTTIHTYRHVYGNTQKDMEFNPTGAISARYWRWLIDGWTEREVQNYYTYESIIYT